MTALHYIPTEGQQILIRAYVHIALNNGYKLDSFGGYRLPRYPWTELEQRQVGIILKACYDKLTPPRELCG